MSFQCSQRLARPTSDRQSVCLSRKHEPLYCSHVAVPQSRCACQTSTSPFRDAEVSRSWPALQAACNHWRSEGSCDFCLANSSKNAQNSASRGCGSMMHSMTRLSFVSARLILYLQSLLNGSLRDSVSARRFVVIDKNDADRALATGV